ncbi:MAG: adenine deaminase [Pseudonocardiales bacterium]|nr:adenine deaminase [Pseudonocardiales bacterium]
MELPGRGANVPGMALDPTLDRLIRDIPKVELHLHIEGTLEPEMVFELAARHGVALPHSSVGALRAAYEFGDLQSFLDLYYAGCDVLRDESDFHAMALAYFERAHRDGVIHAELFFDPQTHTGRGVPMEVVIGGLRRAMDDARSRYGITSELILCFLRHLPEEDAFATLDQALPFLDQLVGVGLDSGERGNPPSKFERVFAAARSHGLRPVAHAGEEGPASYVREALDLLGAERIDHGVRCVEDDALVERLVRDQVALTACPLSNIKLRVFPEMEQHNLVALLRRGLRVTVNSDDPAYFGGYIADNFRAVARALPIGADDVLRLCENAARAAFVPDAARADLLARIRGAMH